MVSGRSIDWFDWPASHLNSNHTPWPYKNPTHWPTSCLFFPLQTNREEPNVILMLKEHFSSTFGYISKSYIYEKCVVVFSTMLETWLSIQFVANKPLIAKCPDTVIVFMGRLWICSYSYFCEYIIFQYFMFIPHSTKGKSIPGNGVLAPALNCVQWTRFTHFFFFFLLSKQTRNSFIFCRRLYLPLSSSNTSIPRDQQSAELSWPLFRMISGATYSGVPQNVQVFLPKPTFLAKPKSTWVEKPKCCPRE